MNLSSKIYREIPPSFLRLRASVRDLRDEAALDGLCENIRQVGIVHPLTVRYCGEGEYEILAGRRRYLAACRLGMDKIPCLVTDSDDGDGALISLSENLQRKNLNYFEEAEGMQQVIDRLGLTQEQLARKLGKSQSAVANKLRLLQMAPPLREQLLSARLSERHARALLSVEGDGARAKALNTVVERRYTVAQTEAYIERLKRVAPPKPAKKEGFYKGFCRDLRLYINSLNRTVDLMKNSGFRTHCETSEDVSKIVYRIEIAK
ncbi:MAG: ParB/RepB/Spo0J family partition protein [Clostridia bacterium]|nr:ParB/RepB/Spo0J family partition protein [Clostridia bacterium]